MADGGYNDSAKNDVVELEAMRKGSFSWHPCYVSLCPSESGLIVKYEDSHYEEEVLKDKEEILSRIRVRSTPLQGDDCTSLQQGNHVLVSDVNKGTFFDAQVEKVVRVRHSKRIHCRCSFTIKWIDQSFGREASNVPASAIMKLSGRSINTHPVVSTFFSLLESSKSVDVSLCSKLVDSVNWETDINVLLEKQIEEINNFADKNISKKFVFGLEVDHKGQSQNTLLGSENNLNGSTWSENKKQSTETSVEIPLASIQEGLTGNRLPLNPLAARAALASLRSINNLEKGDITSPNFDSSSGAKVKGFKKKNKISEKKTVQPSETRVTRSRIQKNNGMSESSRNEKVFLGKDEVIAKADNEKSNFAKDVEKHNYSKRKTRSAAREETEENNVQPKPQLRKIVFSESNEPDLFGGTDSTKSKRVKATPKTAEGAVGRSQSTRRNLASSKMQETRSSPRLRLLQRTPSQTK